MSWSDALPNLLIGLREGLEAGLVVSILLAALHKTAGEGSRISTTPIWLGVLGAGEGSRISTTPIWLGVLGAVSVAASFAAVLTYSTSVLSSPGQEAVGGVLSVLAVGLVTGMVFWMRRTASHLTAHLRGDIQRAVTVGAGALAVTAFLAVGREGLETTLFLWTAVKASGQTAAPLFGAALGLALAVVLCVLLYRRSIAMDLAKFFGRTAIALIVIAAGILAYGLGDLQEAGWLPGSQWIAFDLTRHVDPGSWWVSLISGVTELTPKMTVLQVVVWFAYLVVIPAFLATGRRAADGDTKVTPADAPSASRWELIAGRRPWRTGAVLVGVPVVAAAISIGLLPSAASGATVSVTVTNTKCAPEWTSGRTGAQTFSVDNKSSHSGEITLNNSTGAVVAEIETIGPATTATMTATLGAGTYSFQCAMYGRPVLDATPVQVSGASGQTVTAAVVPVTVADLTPPNNDYIAWARGDLDRLQVDIATIRSDLVAVNLVAARTDWLPAQMAWEEVGASYDSFGDLGVAVDGLPDGLQGGVNDPGFTGLRRLEYGLWHGQSAASLIPVVDQLHQTVTKVQRHLTSDDLAGDPTNLPVRAHEILEDALRDHLSGIDDQGAGAAYPETYADLEVTRTVLGYLAPLIQTRSPGLMTTATAQLNALQHALLATQVGGEWRSPDATNLVRREQVDGAIGALLQTLSSVPDLLEVPPTS